MPILFALRSLAAALATIIAVGAAMAAAPVDQADWTADPRTGCRVWTLSYLRGDAFVTRFDGPCRDGVAHGVGHVRFELTRGGGGRLVAEWRGRFEDGVFVGDAMIAGTIRPLPKNDFLVSLPGDAGSGGPLWIVETADSSGALSLCSRYGGTVLALAGPDFPLLDEGRVKTALRAAAAAYHAHCADRSDVRVSLVAADMRLTAGAGSQTTIEPVLASALVQTGQGGGDLLVLSYQNQAASEDQDRRRRAVQEDRRRARDVASAASQAAFRDFSRGNGVALWLLPQQLDANPFAWSGRTVGLRVQFERMIAPATALLSDRRGTYLVLEQAPADLIEPGEVALAAGVGERHGVKVVGAGGTPATIELVHLRHVASRPCGRGCGELFGWVLDLDAFPWGRDQSQWLGGK